MKNMSFFITTKQFLAKTKTVTRRFGWSSLRRGEIVRAVEKSRGLKLGQKVKPLGLIRIVSIRREPLYKITQSDCILEGFPELTPREFTAMICNHYKCKEFESINRIEFAYYTPPGYLPGFYRQGVTRP